MAEFRLPDLGEGVTEAEIDRWLVREGETIAEDDPLVEVITDKATAEIPSPFAGVVSRLHVAEGDIVPVGTVLVTIGDSPGAGRPAGEGSIPSASPLRSAAETPAREAAVSSASRPQGRPSSSEKSTPTPYRSSGEVRAMPPVRKLARELGVDLARVPGSGPNGRIVRADVEAFASTGAPTDAPSGAPTGARLESAGAPSGARREPLRGIRRTIAERMLKSHTAIPPVTHIEECDVTELDATRRLANERAPDAPKLTFLPFIVRAVLAGLKNFPALNASLDEDRGEIVFHSDYNIGVAVNTQAGLVVPVLHRADEMNLRTIAGEIERLAIAARDGNLKPEEVHGGTFTITSPGRYAGLMATPLILHPQTGILGVHKASDRPVVRDGQIVVRKMMNLGITFDHRVLDGVAASSFILEVVELLEHPAVIAMEG
jgi:pyruvate dehydrogenase E2 component (dihydrolipoamide acetyltransferase)